MSRNAKIIVGIGLVGNLVITLLLALIVGVLVMRANNIETVIQHELERLDALYNTVNEPAMQNPMHPMILPHKEAK